MRFLFYISAGFVLAGCASVPYVDGRTVTPAELINTMGPPSRIAFNITVFGDKWTKDTTEYRYYFREPDGQIGYWSYYYKQQKYISEGGSVGYLYQKGIRLLDIQRSRDLSLIQAYEARSKWLERK